MRISGKAIGSKIRRGSTRGHIAETLRGTIILLLMFLGCAVYSSQGQAYFGTVGGVMTDSSGAVIPGVKLTLTDVEKGFTFTATSNKTGEFLFPSVPPATYDLTAEIKGFDKALRTGIVVSVTQHVTANLALKVASASQTVLVTGQNTSLQTQDATTGQVINKRFVEDLPLVDRNALNLISLAPGVTETDSGAHIGDTGTNFISNGSRNATADVLLNGSSITNFEPNGGITQVTLTPSVESIQEFKVQQANFSAEYGFSGGGSVVNVISESGTNVFHGKVYDFVRNQVLDANDWFSNHFGQTIPGLSRNQYGGTIGGPIVKNKTFFFFDYDGVREISQRVPQAGVPSALERTGDFGEVCGANGGTFDLSGQCSVAQGQISDPYSGTFSPALGGPVASRIIPFNNIGKYASPGHPSLNGTPYQLSGAPGDLIDPVAQNLINLFPLPNITNGTQTIYDNWTASGSSENTSGQFDIQIDQRFTEANLLSAKYSQGWSHRVPFHCFNNFADPCGSGPNSQPQHTFTATDTHTFSPTLLLTTTFAFIRGSEHINNYPSLGVPNAPADPVTALGFPSYLNSNGFFGVPSISIGGGYFTAAGNSIGSDEYGNYRQGQDTGELTVTLAKQLGTQELKVGFDGRIHQQNYIQTNAPNGVFSFDQHGTASQPGDTTVGGGDGFATFLLGYPNAGGYYEIQDRNASQSYQFSGYFQDNWRATPNLTLNLGLRYEVDDPRTERFNRQNYFDPNAVSPLQIPGVGPNGGSGPLLGGEVFASAGRRKVYNTDFLAWQPRFGFAYQLQTKWVVRGGFGIYYGQSRSGATGVAPYGSQGFNQFSNIISTYQSQGNTPYLRLNNPFPTGLNPAPGSSLGLLNDLGLGANGPLLNENRTPHEESWSLGFQRQLPSNVVIDATYIGKKGTDLSFGGDNQLNILPASVENYSQDQVANLLNNFVPNPFQGYITNPNSSLSNPTVQAYQLQLPYPQFTSVSTDVPPLASSIYHAVQITAQKSFSHGLQALVTYSWSKSIDNSSAVDDNTTFLGSFTSLQDPNKPFLERSLSTFDIPQVFQATYVYQLPVGRGRDFLGHSSRIVNGILGGWNTTGIWRLSGGRPLAFNSSYDGTSLPTYGTQRPNISGVLKRNHGNGYINNFFTNPQVLSLPALYAIGNTPRALGDVRTPSTFNADLSVLKDFSLESVRSGASIQFRVEAQNAFNHPTFGTPNTNVDDPNFGTITYTTSSPRQVQLGIKATF